MIISSELNNSNVLIVGASQGIGLGFIKQLLQSELIGSIYATYRHHESASGLIKLHSKHPEKLSLIVMDITDEEQIAEGIKQISREVDKLHLVINCVGILHEGELQPEKGLRQLNTDRNLLLYRIFWVYLQLIET
ncbi:MAG: SDR family NAD(P)-dependent oxidoreductase [Moorea sp. SIO2B7]|nr:SDR family NAD(P)-dependent oxidoreductase [Moorena sp. SIO2B7]